jgi:2-isopropylmalate synthase
MSDRVFIFDTTLRDGEQSCGCSMTVAEKLRMARQLQELGVDIMEAGFPAASEGDLEAVGRIARELSTVRVAALARCHTGDIEAAARALDKAKHARIHTFIATSPIHLKHKLKKTEEQVLEAAVKAIELARKYVDDVEFSAEDATRTSPEVLVKFSEAVVRAGATTVNLRDHRHGQPGAGQGEQGRRGQRALPR